MGNRLGELSAASCSGVETIHLPAMALGSIPIRDRSDNRRHPSLCSFGMLRNSLQKLVCRQQCLIINSFHPADHRIFFVPRTLVRGKCYCACSVTFARKVANLSGKSVHIH